MKKTWSDSQLPVSSARVPSTLFWTISLYQKKHTKGKGLDDLQIVKLYFVGPRLDRKNNRRGVLNCFNQFSFFVEGF